MPVILAAQVVHRKLVCHFIAEHFAAVWLLMVAVADGVGHVLLTHTWALVYMQQHQLVVTCPHSHYFMCFRFKIFV